MNLDYFAHFIRANYPKLEISNDECTEIGKEFKKYLEDKFKDNMDKLESIWNIEPLKVIMNMSHPLKINGYEPALVLHFTNFVEEQKQQILNEGKDSDG